MRIICVSVFREHYCMYISLIAQYTTPSLLQWQVPVWKPWRAIDGTQGPWPYMSTSFCQVCQLSNFVLLQMTKPRPSFSFLATHLCFLVYPNLTALKALHITLISQRLSLVRLLPWSAEHLMLLGRSMTFHPSGSSVAIGGWLMHVQVTQTLHTTSIFVVLWTPLRISPAQVCSPTFQIIIAFYLKYMNTVDSRFLKVGRT